MLPISDRVVEAVAALLYTLIYDQDAGEGWTPEDSCLDPFYCETFLAFAQALLVAMGDHPGDPDAFLIGQARAGIDRTRVSFGWETLAMDQGYTSLPTEAEKHLEEIRAFLADPLAFPERAFLQESDLLDEGSKKEHP